MTPQQIDTSLKTSFVPKQQPGSTMGMAPRHKKETSLLLYIGMFVFIAGALFSGGVYAFHRLVAQDVADLEIGLANVQQVSVIDTLEEIESLDSELKLAQGVYGNHRVMASLFRFLESDTLPGVRYVDFSYSAGQNLLMLNGEAESYEIIAQQSNIFSNSNLVSEHIFSGFTLSELGRVSFSLQITPIGEATKYSNE